MNYKNEHTDRLFKAILSLKNEEECSAFFDDICTVKEIIEISQRLEVARMLYQKKSYFEINEALGVSAATIVRVNKCLKYGAGGYAAALKRMDDINGGGGADAD